MSPSIRRSLPPSPAGPSPLYFRLLRITVGITLFLFAFAIMLLGLLHWYVRPVLAASAHAGPLQRRELALNASLLLVSLLVLLIILLIGIFQFRQWFTASRPVKPTEYPDAWSESARRMKTPPEE